MPASLQTIGQWSPARQSPEALPGGDRRPFAARRGAGLLRADGRALGDFRREAERDQLVALQSFEHFHALAVVDAQAHRLEVDLPISPAVMQTLPCCASRSALRQAPDSAACNCSCHPTMGVQ